MFGTRLLKVSSTASRGSAGAFCGEKSASRVPPPSTGDSGIEAMVEPSRLRFAPTGITGKLRQLTWVLNWVMPVVGGAVLGDSGSLSAVAEPVLSVAVTRQVSRVPTSAGTAT